jgi:excisionase family DNA binding protein
MEGLLTVEQIASILQVKKSTIYALVCRNRIPHIKLTGKILRFRQSEIQEWIENANSVNAVSKKPASKKQKAKTFSKDLLDKLIENARKEVLLSQAVV